jgi:hypothetical protein
VKRRALLSLAVVAIAGLESAIAAAADVPLSSSGADSSPVERFRFHAGAPLLAPAGVASDGSVCIGTADGYVHLLGPDGSFRWSHSVRGAVTQRPILAGQLWLVATSAERIYALTARGTLYWVFRPPSAVASELAADAAGLTYFVGADHFLYGITGHGGVSLRSPFGQPKAGPCASPDGTVWAENQAGNLIAVRHQEVRQVAPGASAAFDFGSPDTLLDPDGNEWRLRSDGVVEVRALGSSRPSSVALTSAPLLGSSWSVFGHYALISARDGLVVALAASAQESP